MHWLPRIACVVIGSVSLLAGGCAPPSIHGLGPGGEVAPAGLSGSWSSGDGTTLWVRRDGATFLVTLESEEMEAESLLLRVRLLRLAGELVYEATLSDEARDILAQRYGPFAVPTHTLGRVEIDGAELRIYELTSDFVDGDRAHGNLLGVVEPEGLDGSIMTGAPGALREALTEAIGDGRFTKLGEFTKVEAGG